MASLQMCHCGWSKMTTYHGLRVHQGKMGCTEKGMRIPETNQYLLRTSVPEITYTMNPFSMEAPFVNISGFPEEWSFPGRQRNAGNKGCTLREITMPEFDTRKPSKEESRQRDSAPITRTPNVPAPRNPPPQTMPAVIGVTKPSIETHQHAPPPTTNVVKTHPSLGVSSGSQPHRSPVSPTFTVQASPATPATPAPAIKETNPTSFETPQHSYQPAAGLNKARRALDFSTGAQQMAEMSLMMPTTPQENALQPKVKEQETDREDEKAFQLKARKDRIIADLLQKIQTREHKMTEVKSSAKACKNSLDAEWLEINSVFTEVIRIVEDARQKALQPVEDRRQRVKREACDLAKKLQEEIDQMKRNMDEVEESSDLETINATDGRQDWTRVNVDTSFSFGTLRTTTTNMMEHIHQKLDKLSSVELRRISTFAVDVKMDPNTAHPFLVVSRDGKEVQDGGEDQRVPSSPGRFNEYGSILGLSGWSRGRSYWEVEVKNKSGWDVGVARGKANRKGKLSLTPDHGYWVVVHYNDDTYAALTAPPITLSLEDKPQRVGVFVDYEEALVSFYDATTQSHIYSFTKCSFDDEIFPCFSPHPKQTAKNSAPLRISRVNK